MTRAPDGMLQPTGADGVYLRTERFESIVRAVEAVVRGAGRSDPGPGFEPLLFLPPVMPREWLLRTDYLSSFPDLIGSVHTFPGGDERHAALLELAANGGDWTAELRPSELALVSAGCHPVYAGLAGTLPAGGRRLEVQATCFRHEPSDDPFRMQVFRQHEFVRVGTSDEALAHRDDWLGRGVALLEGLGLPVRRELATDPFFGRAGRLLARSQRGAELKFEIVCDLAGRETAVAIASANYHLAHFGDSFGILTEDGAAAHSACIGFGLERIALALLTVHGPDETDWPPGVRAELQLDADDLPG